jgi:hypothetical protein
MKRTKIKKEKRDLKQKKDMYKEVDLVSSGEVSFEGLAIHWESVWLSL